jgi:hypothetical protein
LGVEFKRCAEVELWGTTAMVLVLDFRYAVERVEFEFYELERTGRIIKENPLRYMH